MTNPNGRASATSKREVAGQTGYLDAKYDTSGDPLLPDLGNAAVQDDALRMLISLQDGADPAEARMLAAIHNLLYDQWSEPRPADERMLAPGDNGIGSTF